MAITWGSPRAKPSGAGSGPWYQDPYLWANLAGTAANAWASTSSAHQANRTNINLARENRDWQERMANSEIQRRADDIERAGGNRALAFTEGSGASTPSPTAARVEQTYKGEALGGVQTALRMRQELDLMKAQTQNLAASTRKGTAEARLIEQFGEAGGMQDLEEQGWRINKLRNEVENLGLTKARTAQELERFNKTIDDLVAMVKNARSESDINMAALRNVAAIGGVEINKIKPLLDLVIELFGNRTKQEIPRFK